MNDLPTILPGVILPDGRLYVSQTTGLPPGPVSVALQPVNSSEEPVASPIAPAQSLPLPDFLEDPCISAPFDLPLPLGRIVSTKPGSLRLPDPLDESELPE